MKIEIRFSNNRGDGEVRKVVEGVSSVTEYSGFIWFSDKEEPLYACRACDIMEMTRINE
jgi:hypothetical protein